MTMMFMMIKFDPHEGNSIPTGLQMFAPMQIAIKDSLIILPMRRKIMLIMLMRRKMILIKMLAQIGNAEVSLIRIMKKLIGMRLLEL